MALLEVLKKRGYSFRLHSEEEGWGWFIPSVVDLPRVYADALHHWGIDGLRKELDRRLYRPSSGLWLFPSIEIEAPVPRRADLVLAKGQEALATVVVPAGKTSLGALAKEWVAAVERRFGVSLPIVDESVLTFDALETRDLIVFGGSHQNQLALELALRGRTLFVDAEIPGDDGWVVTTHCGLHASGHAVLQIAAAAEHHVEVLEVLLAGIALQDGELRLAHVHRIQPSRAMAARFPSWKAFVDLLPARIVQFQGQKGTAPEEPEALADLLAAGFDCGGFEKGFYNVAPVDIANEAARYYQLSADPRALQLFRALLFRLTDYYLKFPGGACYPADLDFRLGLLVLNFARLEHESIFTDEDRLILVNVLLASARSVYEHSVKFWPPDRDNKGDSRHNHQTFPALSLLYAADYFSRFNLPYLSEWCEYSHAIFSGSLWKRSKQCENSRSYEPFVFEHAAAYSLYKGLGLTPFAPGCFQAMVERQIVTTDNFFRPVDYGDTGVSLSPAGSVSAQMLALYEGGLVRWFAAEGFARNPIDVPGSFLDHPGIRRPQVAAQPVVGDWEHVPLDPTFLTETAPGFPAELAFDKLAFRTGWTDEDQYLLLEGVGGQVSHAHQETNGIVRMNHMGRHWIVSNGYGKRIGITNAGKAFSSRELGPVDHNMLVLKRGGQVVKGLTMNAALQRGHQGDLLWFTGAQLDYGGVDWFRTLIVLSGGSLLVLDRLQVRRPGLESAHIEWNCLGKPAASAVGVRLEQQGVFLEVASPSGWPLGILPGDQSADWKRVLGDGSYPYATFPLAKLVFRLPSLEEAQTCCLATLFTADRGTSNVRITQPTPGSLVIEGLQGKECQTCTDQDLRITLESGCCRIEYAPIPEVPEALRAWREKLRVAGEVASR